MFSSHSPKVHPPQARSELIQASKPGSPDLLPNPLPINPLGSDPHAPARRVPTETCPLYHPLGPFLTLASSAPIAYNPSSRKRGERRKAMKTATERPLTTDQRPRRSVGIGDRQ